MSENGIDKRLRGVEQAQAVEEERWTTQRQWNAAMEARQDSMRKSLWKLALLVAATSGSTAGLMQIFGGG